MKYRFEEEEISKGHYILKMYLEDVPTLDGSKLGLEELFDGDLYGCTDYLIDRIRDVLSGKSEKIDTGSNIFWFTITPDKTSFECIFEWHNWNFTISTQVLLEIATTWNNKLKEFCKKYKIR